VEKAAPRYQTQQRSAAAEVLQDLQRRTAATEVTRPRTTTAAATVAAAVASALLLQPAVAMGVTRAEAVVVARLHLDLFRPVLVVQAATALSASLLSSEDIHETIFTKPRRIYP
jgi:hypothetical protein